MSPISGIEVNTVFPVGVLVLVFDALIENVFFPANYLSIHIFVHEASRWQKKFSVFILIVLVIL